VAVNDDEPTFGRGEDFRERIRREHPELADKIVERIQHRDDLVNAEAATDEVTKWLGLKWSMVGGDISPEQAFRDLDELLEKHPEYFDDDGDI